MTTKLKAERNHANPAFRSGTNPNAKHGKKFSWDNEKKRAKDAYSISYVTPTATGSYSYDD